MTALTITENSGYLEFQNLEIFDTGGYLEPRYAVEATTYSSTDKFNRGIAFAWPVDLRAELPSVIDILGFLQGQAIYGPVNWDYGTLNYYMSTSSWPDLVFCSGGAESAEDGSPTTYVYAGITAIDLTSLTDYELRGAVMSSRNYPGAPAEIDPNKAGIFAHESRYTPPAPSPTRTGYGRLRQRQTFRIT